MSSKEKIHPPCLSSPTCSCAVSLQGGPPSQPCLAPLCPGCPLLPSLPEAPLSAPAWLPCLPSPVTDGGPSGHPPPTPEQVALDSSSLFPQSLSPSQSQRLGMQRLFSHLNRSEGQVCWSGEGWVRGQPEGTWLSGHSPRLAVRGAAGTHGRGRGPRRCRPGSRCRRRTSSAPGCSGCWSRRTRQAGTGAGARRTDSLRAAPERGGRQTQVRTGAGTRSSACFMILK